LCMPSGLFQPGQLAQQMLGQRSGVFPAVFPAQVECQTGDAIEKRAMLVALLLLDFGETASSQGESVPEAIIFSLLLKKSQQRRWIIEPAGKKGDYFTPANVP